MLQARKTGFLEKWAQNFKTQAATFYAKYHFRTSKSNC